MDRRLRPGARVHLSRGRNYIAGRSWPRRDCATRAGSSYIREGLLFSAFGGVSVFAMPLALSCWCEIIFLGDFLHCRCFLKFSVRHINESTAEGDKSGGIKRHLIFWDD